MFCWVPDRSIPPHTIRGLEKVVGKPFAAVDVPQMMAVYVDEVGILEESGTHRGRISPHLAAFRQDRRVNAAL